MKRLIPVALLALMAWFFLTPSAAPTKPPQPSKKTLSKKLISLPNRAPREANPELRYEADPEGSLSLSGQVLDVDGSVAVGAIVWLDTNPPTQTTADAQGWFFFEGLLGREYGISAKRGSAFVGPLSVHLDSLRDPVELRLQRGAALEILVLHGETTQPVTGVKVTIESPSPWSALTDQGGVALFSGLGRGYGTVHLDAPGFSQVRVPLSISGDPARTQREIIYALSGSQISGQVRDASGGPISGATVLVTNATDDYTPTSGDSALTDSAGTFVIPSATLGGHRLYTAHPDFRPSLSEIFVLLRDTPSSGHEITLQRGASLAGQVVDHQEKPIPFARVSLAYEKLPEETTEKLDPKKTRREAFCDERGEFSFKGVIPGKLMLYASEEETTEASLALSVQDEETRNGLRLVVDPGEAISGRVITSDGEGLSNVTIIARSALQAQPDLAARTNRATSNASGEFTLRGLSPGEYTLAPYVSYSSQNMIPYQIIGEPKTYKTGATDAEIVVKKPDTTTMKGVVQFEDGGTPESFSVSIGEQIQRVSGTGEFLFKDIPMPQSRYLEVNGDTLASTSIKVWPLPNQVNDLGVILVPRGRRIEGTVTDKQGKPIAGAEVNANLEIVELNDLINRDEGWRPAAFGKSVITDLQGRFSLDGAPATVQLVIGASHPQRGVYTSVMVPAGNSTLSVNIVLSDGGVLSGRVTHGGKPCRANVYLGTGEPYNAGLSSLSGADGSYRMERINPGAYTVSVSRYVEVNDGGATTDKALQIKDGETATLDVDLPMHPSLRLEVTGVDANSLFNFYLFPGEQKIKTLNEAHKRSTDTTSFFAIKSVPEAIFVDLPPQTYTACVGAWVTEDLKETCQRIQVTAAPDLQIVQLSL